MLQIERKTDIIALTAFMLSAISIIYNFYGFLRGPQIDLIQMKQMTLFVEPDGGESKTIRISAPMTYINTGFAGYDEVVIDEYVTFTLGGQEYVHDWQYFGTFETIDGKFERKNTGPALPFVVAGGSATSEETMFAYHPVDCPSGEWSCVWANKISPSEFLNRGAEQGEVEFEFTGLLASGGKRVERCRIRIDEALFHNLLIRDSKAAGPVCLNAKKRR